MTSDSIVLVRKTAIVCMVAGLIFALVTSSGILAQRLTRGDNLVAISASATATCAAMFVLAFILRPFRTRFGVEHSVAGIGLHHVRAVVGVFTQSLGALLGVLLVHGMLRACALDERPWLCERSPQLVNDLVAIFGALLLVWGAAHRRLGVLASLAAIGVAVAYALTSSRWHLDTFALPAATSFAVTGRATSVQSSVLAQLACTALGMGAFRRPRDGVRFTHG